MAREKAPTTPPIPPIARERVPMLRDGVPVMVEALKDKETRAEFLQRYGKALCGDGFRLPKVY